ncbi:MAG TPA: YMGG-like glycine zipper-containing protein [Candidatus Synoicihabitans sp.]|nr:YMGG-like glycine zipper-containing protein [Candidatus Synoicihabitans sp.]
MKTSLIVSSTVLMAALVGCQGTTQNQRRGAGVGAATGAVIGGIIGHQSGEAGAGAAIGAVVGGAAGGAVGTRQDRNESRSRDTYGYSSNDYIAMMTPAEMDILRARTSSRDADTMASYLTSEEKSNLRRRAAETGRIAE